MTFYHCPCYALLCPGHCRSDTHQVPQIAVLHAAIPPTSAASKQALGCFSFCPHLSAAPCLPYWDAGTYALLGTSATLVKV